MATVAGWADAVVEALRTGEEPVIKRVEEMGVLMDAHPATGLPVS
ncbi:hypothetical protein ACFWPP_30690 [Streptomyces anulatus]